VKGAFDQIKTHKFSLTLEKQFKEWHRPKNQSA
jgi:hypothetical protein